MLDMRDAGFLWRELQAPVAQKLLDQWPDFIFQQFLGRAGDDEVIRISNEVYLWVDCGALARFTGKRLLEQRFQSVQCQVGQRRRDNPALRCARLRGKQVRFSMNPPSTIFAALPCPWECAGASIRARCCQNIRECRLPAPTAAPTCGPAAWKHCPMASAVLRPGRKP